MKLSTTNQTIKDDLQSFVDGIYDGILSPEQLKMALELSFLFNHITTDIDTIIFEYDGFKVKVSGVHDLPYEYAEETVIHTIIKEEGFKSALKQFIRDNRITKLLE
jgi:hypothetical protein